MIQILGRFKLPEFHTVADDQVPDSSVEFLKLLRV